MLQAQTELKASSGERSSRASTVEFHYEPIFWLRSFSVLAYEQLARQPGGANAAFLQELSKHQLEKLDLAAIETAFKAQHRLRSPVFVNAFPATLERLAHRLSITDENLQQRIGLEANEDVPLDHLIHCITRYPDLWWVVDDLDLRPDALDTVANPFLRTIPLTVKFHSSSTLNQAAERFDMNLLPRNWTVIVEGAKPPMLDTLKQRGVNFMQGRDLGYKQANITGTQFLI